MSPAQVRAMMAIDKRTTFVVQRTLDVLVRLGMIGAHDGHYLSRGHLTPKGRAWVRARKRMLAHQNRRSPHK